MIKENLFFYILLNIKKKNNTTHDILTKKKMMFIHYLKCFATQYTKMFQKRGDFLCQLLSISFSTIKLFWSVACPPTIENIIFVYWFFFSLTCHNPQKEVIFFYSNQFQPFKNSTWYINIILKKKIIISKQKKINYFKESDQFKNIKQ